MSRRTGTGSSTKVCSAVGIVIVSTVYGKLDFSLPVAGFPGCAPVGPTVKPLGALLVYTFSAPGTGWSEKCTTPSASVHL